MILNHPTSGSTVERDTKLRFGSLFAGIGGMDLGLERAGMECRWQVEIDPFCREVLAKHWPHVPKFTDITELTGDELERVDLIAGGFPCQDVSLAGLRKGVGAGTRSGLYADMLRIVCKLQPRIVLVENVSGLLVPTASSEPAPISRVLGDLADLGFDAEWEMFPASAFGAPHRRDRVFIVAYARGFFRDTRLLFSRHRKARSEWWENSSEWGIDRVVVKVGTATPSRILIDWRESKTAPKLSRMANGVPNVMERTRGCGNAVVPEVARWIGEGIIATLERDAQNAQLERMLLEAMGRSSMND